MVASEISPSTAARRGPARWGRLLLLLGIALVPPGAAAEEIQFETATSVLGPPVVTCSYGPTWGDFNQDGWEDLFIGNHLASNASLYRNNGDGTFTDIHVEAGLGDWADRHGAVWGDYNNDGLRDLYIAVGAGAGHGVGYNPLFENQDGGHFVDVCREAEVADSLGRSRYPSWVDVNADGWLDLFVGDMATENQLYINRQDGTFFPLPDAGGLAAWHLWNATWTRWDDDIYMDAVLAGDWAGWLRLYRNDGSGGFTDVTESSQLPTTLSGVHGTCWIDYDNDGDQDLYLSRCEAAVDRDAILTGSRDFRFHMYMHTNPEHEDGVDGVDLLTSSDHIVVEMKIGWFDVQENVYLGREGTHPTSMPFFLWEGNHLGRPDFTPGEDFGCYIWQEEPKGAWHIRCSTNYGGFYHFGAIIETPDGAIEGYDTPYVELPEPADVHDRLYANNGDGTFSDATQAAAIDNASSSQTAIAADFDNDGWQDVYVVCEREPASLIAINAPNRLFLNNGDGTFRECAATAGVTCEVGGTGAGAASADYDNDGFLDLAVTNGWGNMPFWTGPQVLYRNLGNANHWIRLRLIGTLSNRDAIGAHVRLVAGGQQQVRVQNGGANDMAQSSMDLHFGLGTATIVDTLSISWPDGARDTYYGLPADQLHVLVEQPSAEVDLAAWEDTWFGLRATSPATPWAPAQFSFALREPATVRFDLFDATGRWVDRLARGRRAAGPHRLIWDGRDARGRRAAPGIYFGRLETDTRAALCCVYFVR